MCWLCTATRFVAKIRGLVHMPVLLLARNSSSATLIKPACPPHAAAMAVAASLHYPTLLYTGCRCCSATPASVTSPPLCFSHELQPFHLHSMLGAGILVCRTRQLALSDSLRGGFDAGVLIHSERKYLQVRLSSLIIWACSCTVSHSCLYLTTQFL